MLCKKGRQTADKLEQCIRGFQPTSLKENRKPSGSHFHVPTSSEPHHTHCRGDKQGQASMQSDERGRGKKNTGDEGWKSEVTQRLPKMEVITWEEAPDTVKYVVQSSTRPNTRLKNKCMM